MLLSLGVGLSLSGVVLFYFVDEEELVWIAGVAAAVAGSLGVGYVAYYLISRRRLEDMTKV